ncbi:retrovirus-related pol polyprotein from transposon TNT 1-94 [Tanacetum coccineum]
MTKSSWIDAMQEEIHEFERLQVWELVPCQDKVMVIKLKWIYKVKTDEFGGVLKNKARLVAQGFRQEDGINFKESFALVEYQSHMYKLKKALYSLKQAPRAWYDMLSSFLLSQHFSKGAIDPTLFTWKAGNDLLLVQIYVDDIIFASTNTVLCNEFANQMTTKFNMSMMRQMSFFLGLQISQSPRGIFLNQSKYSFEIIKKFGLLTSNSVDTPMVEKNKLDEDLHRTPVVATLYHGMIGFLMYLTSSRPDLIYAVCLCARY